MSAIGSAGDKNVPRQRAHDRKHKPQTPDSPGAARAATSSNSASQLQVVGSAVTDLTSASVTGFVVRSPSQKAFSRASSLTGRPSLDTYGIARIPRPSEVYAAAAAELQDADSASLLKLQQLRTQAASPTPSSPGIARKRAASAYAPGALPALPASPKAGALIPSRTNSRINESAAAASILAFHNKGDEYGNRPGTVTEIPVQPLSVHVARRITSAPDSQQVALRTGPGVHVPRIDLQTSLAFPQASLNRYGDASQTQQPLLSDTTAQLQQQHADAVSHATTSTTEDTSGNVAAASNVLAEQRRMPIHVTGICTVFSSPRSGESTPGTDSANNSNFSAAQLTSKLSSPSNVSPTRLQHSQRNNADDNNDQQQHASRATTPVQGSFAMWPKPPSQDSASLNRHPHSASPTRRTHARSMLASPESRFGSPPPAGGAASSSQITEPANLADQPTTQLAAAATAVGASYGRVSTNGLNAEPSLAAQAQQTRTSKGRGLFGPPPELMIPLPSLSSNNSGAQISMHSGQLLDTTSNDSITVIQGAVAPGTVGGMHVIAGITLNAMNGSGTLSVGPSVFGNNGIAKAHSNGNLVNHRQLVEQPSGGLISHGSGMGNSPAVTPNSRPGSGRGRPVQVLIDAVRSRDESRFLETIEYLRLPNGCVAGLNDRHPVTGRTPLHEAVMLNNQGIVRTLLSIGADSNTGHTSQGPPLLHAAAWGESAMIALLLDARADVSAKDIAGYTALHYACAGGHVEAAGILLAKGADPQAAASDGDTPRTLATNHPQLLAQLLWPSPSSTAQRHHPTATGSKGQHATVFADYAVQCQTAGLPVTDQPQVLTQGVGVHTQNSDAIHAEHPADDLQCHATLSPANSSQLMAQVQQQLGMESTALPQTRQPVTAPAGSSLVLRPSTGQPSGLMVISPTGLQPVTTFGSRPPSQSQLQLQNDAELGLALVKSPSRPGSLSSIGSVRRAPSPRVRALLPDEETRGRGRLTITSPPSGRQTMTSVLSSPSRRQSSTNLISPSCETAASTPGRRAEASNSGTNGVQLDQDETSLQPVNAPTVVLPRSVRRQLSKGAMLQDIIHAFQDEDQELVRKNPNPTGMAATLNTLGWKLHAAGIGNAAGGVSVLDNLQGRLQSRPSVGNATGADPARQQDTSHGESAGQQPQQPHQQLQRAQSFVPTIANSPRGLTGLAAAVTMTPRIRFGIDVHKNPPLSRQGSHRREASQEIGLETNIQGPDADIIGPPSQSGQVQASNQNNAAEVSGVMQPAAQQLENIGSLQQSPGCDDDNARTSNASATSVDAATPPLVRVLSPPHSPPMASSFRKRNGVVTSPTAIDAARSKLTALADGVLINGVPREQANDNEISAAHENTANHTGPGIDVLRVSQAAHAMATDNRFAGTSSHEALALRALQMFSRSVELQTGGIQWTKGELLGEGSYGRVYAGLNQTTGELMAVKVLELLTHGSAMREAGTAQLTQLTQELNLYKKLSHQHVVGYIDHHFDLSTSTLYIFLEYVPGGSIASMLSRFGRFSEELVRNYTRQLLLGLDYLHTSRVVHRDVKGANVLVGRDGVVKLADFGASKAVPADTITDCMRSIKGSVFWMAPEVIKGTGYNHKADIWSLGCTVIEMLTGKHPWPNLDNALTAMFQIAKQQEGPPRPTTASPLALDFLDACFRHNPKERPSAAGLLDHPFVANCDSTRPRQ